MKTSYGFTGLLITYFILLFSSSVAIAKHSGPSIPGLSVGRNAALVSGVIGPSSQTINPNTAGQALTGTPATGGNGTYSYQWQLSTDNNTWSMIGGSSGLTYIPGTQTFRIYYRLASSSGAEMVFSNSVVIDINPLMTGSISPASQSVNPNTAPAALHSTSATGGTGNYSYKWQISTDNNTWTPISSSSGLSYQPGNQTFRTYYRLSCSDGKTEVFSSSVVININPLKAGSISPASQTINYNTAPTVLNSSLGTGGTGNYSYKWQISTDNNTWTTIPSSSGLSYQAGAQTFRTYYRMSCSDGTTEVFGNSAVVNVYPELVAGSISPIASSINYNTSPGQLSGAAATGGNNTYTYQWQRSVDNGTIWSSISGATGINYTPGKLTQSTIYRRQSKSNGVIAYSNTIVITVYPAVTAGVVSPATLSINYNTAPGTLSTTAATGGNDSYSYQWQSSIDGGSSWNDLPGATAVSHVPEPLIQNTRYRVKVTSNQVEVFSSVSRITVYPSAEAGSISPSALSINYGSSPGTLNGTAASGGNGTYSYQWQSSFDGGGNWNAIAGAAAASYTAGILTGNTIYRRQVTSNGAVSYSNVSSITVYPELIAGTISPSSQAVLVGSSPGALSSTAATGGKGSYTYQWESSVNGSAWSAITGATSLTYTPGMLVQSMSYRVLVTSNGVNKYTNLGTINVSCAPLNTAPSQNQNYIRTRTVKKEGVLNQGQLEGLSICELNEQIQYFDGLGRPLQNISVKGSPELKDIVQPFIYDVYGREDTRYLPYADPGIGDGSYRANALSSGQGVLSFYAPAGSSGAQQANGLARTEYPYSKTIFEPSPLNRVTEQGSAGAAWQPVTGSTAGHTVKLSYGTNNSTTAYTTTGFGVRLYLANVVSGAGNEHLRTLTSSGLYGAGQLYLTISRDENWVSADGKVGTTEEYKDKEGRIVLKRTFNKVGTTIETLSTYYVYDDFGNLCYVLPPRAKPDSGSISDTDRDLFCYQYRYDRRQRLVEKWIPGTTLWASMVYNKLDQVIFSQDARQAGLATKQWNYTKYDAFGRVVISGVYAVASSTRIQLQGIADTSRILWETRLAGEYSNNAIPKGTAATPQIVNYYDNYGITGIPDNQSASFSQMLKGLLTATRVKVLGTTNTFLWTINYYDDKARVVKLYKQHYFSGAANTGNYDEIINKYNFANELTASTRVHHVGTVATTIASSYTYDHMGRKLTTKQSINGADSVMLSKMDYDALGQLRRKSRHGNNEGTTFLQNSRYAYNERGWLKKDTSAQFSYELQYQDGTTPQYNGNISGQLWGAGGTNPNKFTYRYDKLNRLLSGISTQAGMSEVLTYDEMGNISSLKRDAATVGNYYYTGNRLDSIKGGGLAAGAYVYDDNGNATKDGRSGVTLTYNELNLPVTANKTGLVLSYVYDATGNKLRKTVNGAVRHYIDGIEYDGTTLDIIHTEEGIARKSGATFSYEYNLTDHLGNVRYSFNKHPTSGAIQRLQSDDYYPFGKRKSGSPVSLNNKYLYNGKELQDELSSTGEDGQYDYGARFYDPVIGRWNVVDPLAGYFEDVSPYNYANNNPILMVDLDGMASEETNNLAEEKPKPQPKPIQLKEVVIKSGPAKGLVAEAHSALGITWTSYRLPQAVVQANQADALAFLGNWTQLGKAITVVNSLLDIASKPLKFEKPVGKISRVSAGEIKQLKDKGFDPHSEKPKQGGPGEKIDLWKDGVGNLFYRTERGSNYEPLYENIYQILK